MTRGLSAMLIGTITALLATTAAYADDSLQRVTAAKVLKVAVAQNAPWVIKKANGTYAGADIDLLDLMSRDLGVTVQYVELPFADLVPAVARGQVDMAAAGIAITPERARLVAFSTAAGLQSVNMVADRASLGGDPQKAVTAPGFKIAVVAQSTDATAARGAFPNASVTEYPSEAAALAALIDGRAQAMVATAPVPQIAAKMYDRRLRRVGGSLLRTSEAFALRPDDTRLLTFVNNWIAVRLVDGTIHRVGRHWLGSQAWLQAIQPDEKPATVVQ